MVGPFLAPVLGQGPIEFGGQFPRLFDQGCDDAFGVLVVDLDQHDVTRVAFDLVATELFLAPPIRSPSQWPGTARSSTDAAAHG